jgi:hypothetical protein
MRTPAAAFRSQPAGPAQLKLSTPPNQPGTARLRTRPSLHQSSHLISHTRSLTEIHPSLHKHQILTLVLSAPHPVHPVQTSYRPAPSAPSAPSVPSFPSVRSRPFVHPSIPPIPSHPAPSVLSAPSAPSVLSVLSVLSPPILPIRPIRPSRPFCAFPLLRQSQRDCVPEPKVGLRHEGLPWVHPQQIHNPNVGCVPNPARPTGPPPRTPRPRSVSPVRPNPSSAMRHSRPPAQPDSSAPFAIPAPSVLFFQPRPSAPTRPFPLPTSHFLPRLLLPGLFNHKGIGWLVPRSHAPLNVAFCGRVRGVSLMQEGREEVAQWRQPLLLERRSRKASRQPILGRKNHETHEPISKANPK